MGMNRLNDKHARHLAKISGLDVEAALVRSHGDHRRTHVRTTDDKHYIVDRWTGEYTREGDEVHWSSCPPPR